MEDILKKQNENENHQNTTVDEAIIGKDGIMKLPNSFNYKSTKLFKSVRRSIRRSNLTYYGTVIPKRLCNNRKRTSGRKLQSEMEKFLQSVRGKHFNENKQLTYMEQLFETAKEKYYGKS